MVPVSNAIILAIERMFHLRFENNWYASVNICSIMIHIPTYSYRYYFGRY